MTTVRAGCIIGCPRSGTTFLLGALEAAAHTEGLDRGAFPPILASLVGAGALDEHQDAVDHVLQAAVSSHRSQQAASRSAAVAEALRGNAGPGELLDGLRRRRRIDTVVVKEPFLSFCPYLPHRALPDARLVYIHRDGRDVADSLVRTYDVLSNEKLAALDTAEAPLGRRCGSLYVPWWVASGVEDDFLAAPPYVRAAWMWAEMARRTLDFLEDQDPDDAARWLTVRYESFVTEPIDEGRRVLRHLEVPERGRVRSRLRAAHRQSVGVHRRRPRAEVEWAEQVAGPELERLGYRTGPVAGSG